MGRGGRRPPQWTAPSPRASPARSGPRPRRPRRSRPATSSDYRRPTRGGRARALAAGAAARASLARVLSRTRLRTVLLALLVCMPLLAGGFMLLRHSSLVAVRKVQITGVRGPQSGAIGAALTSAAHGMSTLAVSDSALLAAVSQYPVVQRRARRTQSSRTALRIVGARAATGRGGAGRRHQDRRRRRRSRARRQHC